MPVRTKPTRQSSTDVAIEAVAEDSAIQAAVVAGFLDVLPAARISLLDDAVRSHEEGSSVGEIEGVAARRRAAPDGAVRADRPIKVDVTIAALESKAAAEDGPCLPPAATLGALGATGRLGRRTAAGSLTYQRQDPA